MKLKQKSLNSISNHRSFLNRTAAITLPSLSLHVTCSLYVRMFDCTDVQSLEELSLSLLTRLEEVLKEQRRWRDIAEANVRLLRDFAFQEWLCSQSLEHYYHT